MRKIILIVLILLSLVACGLQKNSLIYKDNDFSLISNIDNMQGEDNELDEIKYDIEYLREYVKYFHYILNYETSYDRLTNIEKAAIITYASGLSSERNEQYIKMVAKRYFDIDNYELPLGSYEVIGSGDLNGNKWCINKLGETYISSIEPRGIDVNKIIDFYSVKIDKDKVILKGNLFVENNIESESVCYVDNNTQIECIKGYYEYEFIKKDNNLVFDKITYKKNKYYNKNSKLIIFG